MKPALAIAAVSVTLLVWGGCRKDTPKPVRGGIKQPGAPELTGKMKQRLATAESRYEQVKQAARMGMTKAEAAKAIGKPSSKTPADGPIVAETWKYDIDTYVYYLLDFNADGLVVGTGGSGIKFLVESLYAQMRKQTGNS